LRVYKEARNYFTLYLIEANLFIKHNRFRRIGNYRIGQIKPRLAELLYVFKPKWTGDSQS